MAHAGRELRPAGILDIATEMVADALFARTVGSASGFLYFAVCAYVTLAGIGWLYDHLSSAIGLKAAAAILLVAAVPLCMLPVWLMGIGGAVVTAAWRARRWHRATLIKSGRGLVDLESLDVIERVQYWLLTGRRDQVLALGDEALPALKHLLAGAPRDLADLERAARSGPDAWQAAVAAYRRAPYPEIAGALADMGSLDALCALEQALPARAFFPGQPDAPPIANPMVQDLVPAIHRLQAMRRAGR
jgi:hypothetical protein